MVKKTNSAKPHKYARPNCHRPALLPARNAQWDLSKMVTRSDGRPTYNAKGVPESLVNPWPKELESEFQRRAHEVIVAQTKNVKAGVNTYFENEKRSYGYLMAHVLGGNTETALRHLQARDHQHDQWHRETAGIDYYACFTLKHQMRKYFYFGDLLEPSYRRQMFDGAKLWTVRDPLKRPPLRSPGEEAGLGTRRA